MKLVRSGRFERGGFFGLRAVFLHPFHPDLFLFLCNKEKMQRPETTFIPFFTPLSTRRHQSTFTPALAYRRGFDSHHLFSVDEYYWEDRPAYYAALEQVRLAGKDFSRWMEYSALGLKQRERVGGLVQRLQEVSTTRMVLTPRHERRRSV